MVFHPIVDRELRVASRRGWTYWGRVLVAFVGLGILGVMVSTMVTAPSSEVAQTVFRGLATLCFGFTLMAGTLFSADSLARERREGTLGLLFLTDLRGLDVALGKLVGTGLGSVYCLAAVMPLLAVPLLLGGVTVWDFLRVVLTLLATLWLSLTMGILASTLARRVRSAAVWAAVLMSVACIGIPAAGHLLGAAEGPWIWCFSPFGAFYESFEFAGSSPSDPGRYAGSLGYMTTLGAGGLAWATRRLPNLWQDKAVAPARRRDPAAVGPVAQRSRRDGPLDWPILWLSNRSARVRSAPKLVLAGVGIAWALILWLDGGDPWSQGGWIAMSLSLHAAFKWWLAIEAPRVFHEARRTGEVELLLTTGLSASDLLGGRLRALGRLCLLPLVVLTAVDILFGVLCLSDSGSTQSFETFELFWSGHLALLWFDAFAVAVTGMWVGARTQGQRAGGTTWLRVLVLPYLLWILGTILVAVAQTRFGIDLWKSFQGDVGFLWAWLLLNLAVSIGNAAWSYTRLKVDLRTCLSRPLGRAPGRVRLI